MPATLNARPGINGNSRDDFAEAYKALTVAINAAEDARASVARNVVHGRNYQHLGRDAAVDARDDDLNTFSHIENAARLLSAVRTALLGTIE